MKKINPPKSTHGGKRPGAGRPAVAPDAEARKVVLTEEAWERIKAEGKRQGLSGSALVQEWAMTLPRA